MSENDREVLLAFSRTVFRDLGKSIIDDLIGRVPDLGMLVFLDKRAQTQVLWLKEEKALQKAAFKKGALDNWR